MSAKQLKVTFPKKQTRTPQTVLRRTTGHVAVPFIFKLNARHARAIWGALSKRTLENLKRLSETHSLEVAAGELQFLGNRWYVTNAGLLQIARREGCAGIRTSV